MWDGWVEPEAPHTYIVGHWNYEANTVKDIYVVSNSESVELFLNGKSLGKGKQSSRYLFSFENVTFEAGKLEAIGYGSDGLEQSRHSIETAGEANRIQITTIENPQGFKADGADMAIVQFEIVDKEGRRCPLDNRMVHFHLWGEGEWRGGIALRSQNNTPKENGFQKEDGMLDGPETRNTSDNYILSRDLPVECGVNRAIIRSTENPGTIYLTAYAEGLAPVTVSLKTTYVAKKDGLSEDLPSMTLPCVLTRGETPSSPSYKELSSTVDVINVKAGSNHEDAINSMDDNELSEWKSNGKIEDAWITYQFAKKAKVDEIAIKLTGWRNKCYPLAVYAGKKKVWEGMTYATLGYVHLYIDKPVSSNEMTIKMLGPVVNSSAFGDTKELAGGNAGELDRFITTKGKVELRVVEVDFLEKTNK
jgi:hypothetical protein